MLVKWLSIKKNISQVGFTGNPFSNCVDIDECAIPDLNTCGGGMNPHGVDADMALDKESEFPFYIGEPGPDGLSQVFI